MMTIVYLKMANKTEQKNLCNDTDADYYYEYRQSDRSSFPFMGTFTQGYIYPHASVPLIFCWHADQIPSSRLIKNVIVKYHEQDEITKEKFVSTDSSARIVKGWPVPKPGCFIATAVYGTPLAPEINTLRIFRDNILLSSSTGKKFVNFYYRFSPPIANFISKHSILKTCIRKIFIAPSVNIAKLLNKRTNIQGRK